jgi:hypothetical protein
MMSSKQEATAREEERREAILNKTEKTTENHRKHQNH